MMNRSQTGSWILMNEIIYPYWREDQSCRPHVRDDMESCEAAWHAQTSDTGGKADGS